MRCSMTGRDYPEFSDGIWDDGEWISWDWINGQLAVQERRSTYPIASPELVDVFEDLVEVAREYNELTGRYLQIWGELGELYGEIKYGMDRHPPGRQGSDGRLGNDWIEVKTISPEKKKETVQVKRAGNFNKLLVVKITENFKFESVLVDRKALGKGEGGVYARFKWEKDRGGEENV